VLLLVLVIGITLSPLSMSTLGGDAHILVWHCVEGLGQGKAILPEEALE
jgi:hypothetical protein